MNHNQIHSYNRKLVICPIEVTKGGLAIIIKKIKQMWCHLIPVYGNCSEISFKEEEEERED